MQIERMQARLRPRNAWEAMDLGTRLFQHGWKPALLLWVAFTLPAFLLLFALFDSPWLAAFCFWWLKPLWERPLLAYFSQALFDEPFSLVALIRTAPGYARHSLLYQLTLGRLNFARSFYAPVLQLERLPASHRHPRFALLARGQPRAITLTLLLYHIEQVLTFGLYSLVFILIPWHWNVEAQSWFLAQEQLQQYILMACWYGALALCEPLYVATGFALYLNRRTWLEGWDLELDFRNMADQRSKRTGPARTLNIAVLLLVAWTLSALVTPLTPASAQPVSAHSTSEQSPSALAGPQQRAIDIVASDAFMPVAIKRDWQFDNPLKDPHADSTDASPGWLQKLVKWLLNQEDAAPSIDPQRLHWVAQLLEFLLWVVAIACLVWLLLRLTRWVADRPLPRPRRKTHVHTVSGMTVAADSLPAHPAEAALHLLERGQVRDSLSLLYRATLSHLAQTYPLSFSDAQTETECVQLTDTTLGHAHPASALLRDVTRVWMADAWGHQLPEPEAVVTLITRWQQLTADLPEQEAS